MSPGEIVIADPDVVCSEQSDEERLAHIEEAIAKALQDTSVNASIRTTARVKATIEAYTKVYYNFCSFIIKQAEELSAGRYGASPFKEVSIANLVARWLTETEAFLEQNEHLLSATPGVMRQKFIEDKLAGLSESSRDRILAGLQERRQELAVWLAEELQKSEGEIVDADS